MASHMRIVRSYQSGGQSTTAADASDHCTESYPLAERHEAPTHGVAAVPGVAAGHEGKAAIAEAPPAKMGAGIGPYKERKWIVD